MTPVKFPSKGTRAISSISIAVSLGVVVVISNVIFVPVVWNEISSTWSHLDRQLRDVEMITSAIKETLSLLPTHSTRYTREAARQRLTDESLASSKRLHRSSKHRRRAHRKRVDAERRVLFGSATRSVTHKELEEHHFGIRRQCVCSLDNRCPAGPPGPPGQRGEDGIPGRRGKPGMKGIDAEDVVKQYSFTGCLICSAGPDGPPGEEGQTGVPGPRGPPGAYGLPGRNGVPGSPGDMGPPGKPGKEGKPGPVGQSGMNGVEKVGKQGTKGKTGPRGPRGEPGDDGDDGEEGEIGPPGITGGPGEPGEKGAKGKAGLIGLPGIPGVSPNCDCKQIIRGQSSHPTQRHSKVHSLETKHRDAQLSSADTIKDVNEVFKERDGEEDKEEGSAEWAEAEEEEESTPNTADKNTLLEVPAVSTTPLPKVNDEKEERGGEDFEEDDEQEERAEGVDEQYDVISITSSIIGEDRLQASSTTEPSTTHEKVEERTTTTTVTTSSSTSAEPSKPSQGIFDGIVKVRSKKVKFSRHSNRVSHPTQEFEESSIQEHSSLHPSISGSASSEIDGDSVATYSENYESNISLKRPPMLQVSADIDRVNQATSSPIPALSRGDTSRDRPPLLQVSAEVDRPTQEKSSTIPALSRSDSRQSNTRMVNTGQAFETRKQARQRILEERLKLAHRKRLQRQRNGSAKTIFPHGRPSNRAHRKGRPHISQRPSLITAPVHNPIINLFNVLPDGIYAKPLSRVTRPPKRAYGPATDQRKVRIPLVATEEETAAPQDGQDRLFAIENELRNVVNERMRSSSEEKSSEKQAENDGKKTDQNSEVDETTSETAEPPKDDIRIELASGTIDGAKVAEYAIPRQQRVEEGYKAQQRTDKRGSESIMIAPAKEVTYTPAPKENEAEVNIIHSGINIPRLNELINSEKAMAGLHYKGPRNSARKRINILLETDSQIPLKLFARRPQTSQEVASVFGTEFVPFTDRVPFSPLSKAEAVLPSTTSPEGVRVIKTKSAGPKRNRLSELMVDEGRQGELSTGTKLVRVSTGNSRRKQSSGKKQTASTTFKRKSRTTSSKKRASKKNPQWSII